MPKHPWHCAHAFVVLALAACGDDAGTEPTYHPPPRDAGREAFDAHVPPVPIFPDSGFGPLIDGAPPDALAGDPCAVDTNKLFELVRSMDVIEPSQLAVDAPASRFGVAYVGTSPGCGNALYVAEIEGPSGAPPPEVSVAVEECTQIRHPAITRADDAWLFAFVDDRLPGLDIWAQAFDPSDASPRSPHRVTESTREKTDLQIASLGPEGAIAAWIETAQDADFERTSALKLRALWPNGEPYLPEVVVDAAPERPPGCPPPEDSKRSVACMRWLDRWSYHELRLARIGTSNAALAYRRERGDGSQSEIVLRVFDLDGNAIRDPWVLTANAGSQGNVDLATDEEGGAVIYSVAAGSNRDLWLQRLDEHGGPAQAMIGNIAIGPATPVEIVSTPLVAVDASAAKLPSGFAVAYRAIPGAPGFGTGIASPQVRLLFLNGVGEFRADSSIAFSEAAGGRTSIAAAYDGRIVIAWTDAHEDASISLTAVRVPCVGR